MIKAELASLKVLDKHDYDNYKAHYDKVTKEYEANVKTAEKAVAEAVADGEVTMAELHAIAATRNTNALPLEGADGEEEEAKRAEVLKKREEITPVKIDTPLGEPPIVDEEVEEVVESVPAGEEFTEETFRALPAGLQKELIKGKVTEKGQDSNADKRVALYFS